MPSLRPRLEDALQVLRGVLMGGADVVPGVSGGTVALVVGIYDRLVAAISRFDLILWQHVRQRRWRGAAEHLDLRFLCTLGCGILLGILACGGLMNTLLTAEATRTTTLAAFFGMIVASSLVVVRMIDAPTTPLRAQAAALGVLGVAVAWVLTGLPPSTAELTPWYVFFSGMIAICAMILPGISGAYILLILGVYVPITDILKRLPRGEVTLADAGLVAIFALGCAIGLLSFSKVLKWLLARHEPHTMAVLAGFMIGALRRIWPFQRDLTPEVESLKEKEYVLYWPEAFDGTVIAALVAAVIAFTAVVVIDRSLRVHEQRPLSDDAASDDAREREVAG